MLLELLFSDIKWLFPPWNTIYWKNHAHMNKVGHTSKFLFGIYWWTRGTTIYFCTKNLDDMMYNSWDIECGRLKSVTMGHFFPFYTSVPKIGTVPEIRSETDKIFCDLGHFLAFYPLTPTVEKIKIFKKWKRRMEIS